MLLLCYFVLLSAIVDTLSIFQKKESEVDSANASGTQALTKEKKNHFPHTQNLLLDSTTNLNSLSVIELPAEFRDKLDFDVNRRFQFDGHPLAPYANGGLEGFCKRLTKYVQRDEDKKNVVKDCMAAQHLSKYSTPHHYVRWI